MKEKILLGLIMGSFLIVSVSGFEFPFGPKGSFLTECIEDPTFSLCTDMYGIDCSNIRGVPTDLCTLSIINGTGNDTLYFGGHLPSYYMTASTDNWVNIAGDIMTGDLNISTGPNYVNISASGRINMTDNLTMQGQLCFDAQKRICMKGDIVNDAILLVGGAVGQQVIAAANTLGFYADANYDGSGNWDPYMIFNAGGTLQFMSTVVGNQREMQLTFADNVTIEEGNLTVKGNISTGNWVKGRLPWGYLRELPASAIYSGIYVNKTGDIMTGDLNFTRGTGFINISASGTLETSGAITGGNSFFASYGTAGAPSYSFTSEEDSGMYHISRDKLGFTVGGALTLSLDSYGIMIVDGVANAPSFSFINDDDTGFYRIGADNLGITLGGTKKVDFAAAGMTITGDVHIANTSGDYRLTIGSADKSDQIGIFHDNTYARFRTTDGGFEFMSDESPNAATIMTVRGRGTGYAATYWYDGAGNRFGFYVNVHTLMDTSGGSLFLQSNADNQVWMYYYATEGETPWFRLFGRKTGDVKRDLRIRISPSADDTIEFSGVSNYWFDGTIKADVALEVFSGSGYVNITAAGDIVTSDDIFIGDDLFIGDDTLGHGNAKFYDGTGYVNITAATGNINMTGNLSIGSGTSGFDSTMNRLGINTNNPRVELDVNGMIRTTGYTAVPSTGNGTEIYYLGSGGYVISYDRGSLTYMPLSIYGSNITITAAAGVFVTDNMDVQGYMSGGNNEAIDKGFAKWCAGEAAAIDTGTECCAFWGDSCEQTFGMDTAGSDDCANEWGEVFIAMCY